MSLITSIKLVKSLSGSEKRFFKLYAKRQTVDRIYLDLFQLIDHSNYSGHEEISLRFIHDHPKASLHNTSRYLTDVITDCLIQLKMSKDASFQLLNGIMKVRVLQERSLMDEGYTELKKLRKKAIALQHPISAYLTYREELNHLSDNNFQHLNDKELVELQMKAKSIIRDLNSIHDHHSLFELLKYRLAHAGKISSKKQLEQLNDLVLSEMGLITNRSGNSFVAQKMHLLFQSFFFTHTGDYKSALKTFAALNKLYEQNISLLDHPPTDYLSALHGILDNLHMLGFYDQISFYIQKVQQLNLQTYPEYFRNQVQKIAALYEVVVLAKQKKYSSALDVIQHKGKDWLLSYAMVDEEKQWELYYYTAVLYLNLKEFKKAHKWIDEAMHRHKMAKNWLVVKAIRLLNIIIYYEQGEREYLEYEVKAYKRFFGKDRFLQTEQLLLQFIQNSYTRVYKQKALPAFVNDKYEAQLLKYFDFTEWVLKNQNRGLISAI